jgi:protein tyrosine phosphatase
MKKEPKIRELENPIPISKWLPWVSDRKSKSFEEEFYYLSQITDSSENIDRMMTDPKLMSKNRYCDILTFNHSRIVLAPRHGGKAAQDFDTELDSYINANFIDVSARNDTLEPTLVWRQENHCSTGTHSGNGS